MKLNMGTADRVIRIVIAAILAAVIAMGQVAGTVAIVLGVVAAVLLLTGIVGFCPAYLPIGLSTRKGEGE
jgi:hypothetical protein